MQRWMRAGALLLVLACSLVHAQASREHWYQAVVDHADSGLTILVVEQPDGSRALRQIDLSLLGIVQPAVRGWRHEGEWFYPLTALTGYTVTFDDAQARVHLRRREATAAVVQAQLDAAARVQPDAVAPVAAPLAPVPVPVPAPAPAPALAPAAVDTADEEWLVDVAVNGQAVPGTWLLQRVDGAWQIDAGLLPAARLRALATTQTAPVVPLQALAGDDFVLDRGQLRLDLTVPPERFEGASHSLADTQVAVGNRQFSGIVGYDIAAGSDDGERWSSALLDIAVARGNMSCDSVQAWGSRGGGLRRLDSGCFFDWPSRMLSLRVGDAITRSGAFAQSVRYGGVRIGTDYDLAPYLLTVPALSVEGSARLPSLLEVFIDQRLALRTDLPPGPFDVRDIPAVVGSGELRAVVTDALGRQTVIDAPFYSDPMLLRPGLLDWSAEAGRLRLGVLTDDDRYGEQFAAFSARRGMTESLTVDVHAEAREHVALVGTSATIRLGLLGVAEVGASMSRDRGVDGRAHLLGYSYRGRDWSVGIRRWRGDSGYSALGYAAPGLAPAQFSQAHLGRRIGRVSLNLAAIIRDAHDGTRDRFATASLSLPIWLRGLLHLSALHPLDGSGETTFGLNVSLPLGPSSSAYVAVQEQDGRGDTVQAGVQRSLPPGSGVGYRVQTTRGDGRDALFAQGAYRGERGTLELAAAQSDGREDVRAQLSGGLVATGDGVFATRLDPGSYATVDVGAPDVRVYRDHQPVAVSRDDGIALVSGLRAFERNPLQVSLQDLPMDRRIASDEIVLVPGRNQALAAEFDLQQVHAVSGTLRRDDGSAVPAGATIVLAGQGIGQVGYDGLVFLEFPSREARTLRVDWPLGHCILVLAAADFAQDPQQPRNIPCVTEATP